MSECRNINPTGKEVVHSKLWDDIRKDVDSPEEADRVYRLISSPEFIQRWGNWIPSDITFLRHGITSEDVKGQNSGWNNISLNEEGIKESEKTAQEIKEKGIKTLYVSPIKRAQETAEIIKKFNPDLNIITVDFLKPWGIGIYESKPSKDFDEKYYVNNPDEIVPGGESFNTQKNRFTTGLNALMPRLDKFTALLTHSKILDTVEGLESTLGKWNDGAIKNYFAKGIDDRSPKQTWPLRYWNTEVAQKTSNISEPHWDDIKDLVKELQSNPVQGNLLSVPLAWKESARRIYEGFKDSLVPKTYGSRRDFVGFTTRTGESVFELYRRIQEWKKSIPDFDAVKVTYDKNSKLINFVENKSNVYAQLDNSNEHIINAGLKVVNALQNPNTTKLFDKFYKTNPEKFYNELLNLGATKDQVNLLRSYNNANEPKSLIDMVTGIMSELSYTVEVHTAKKTNFKAHYVGNELIQLTPDGRLEAMDELGNIRALTKEEVDKLERKVQDTTQYYSDMIVPGGTNYLENEIRTPDIIPSIKGHAQFSTPNGIGWFRSDDKTTRLNPTEADYNRYKKEVAEQGYSDNRPDFRIENTKTRRILEVQSDYNQNIRNNFTVDGINYFKDRGNNKYYIKEVYDNINGYEQFRNKEISKKDYDNAYEQYTEHPFLDLLRKEDNWIPFFIKAVVQDSAKKGYEKVLFPTGDTASKVEGHETLEQFKKQKENRIKELENKRELYKSSTESSGNDPILGNFIKDRDKKIDDELKALKEELKTVETEGFAALKPIYDFYESRVKNTLNKIYGKEQVNRIKDEYGNEWYQIVLNPLRDLGKILFQKASTGKPDPELEKKFIQIAEKLGFDINRFTNGLTDEDGNPVSDIARIDLSRRVIDVAQNKAGIDTLPEEVIHGITAMLPDNNPLLNKMKQEVTGYQMYYDVLSQYRNDKRYRNVDNSINYDKIKKEAIDKILTKLVIDDEPLDNEPDIKNQKALSWWQKLWEWFKNLLYKYFGKDTNPFDTFAEKIKSEDFSDLDLDKDLSGEYAQKAPDNLVDSIDKLSKDQDRIHLDDTIEDKTKQKRHDYWYTDDDGNKSKAAGSVTSIAVDKALRNRRGSLAKRSEVEKQIHLLYADFGTQVHAYAENILKGCIDTNRELKGVADWADPHIPTDNLGLSIYNKLQKYIFDLLNSYESGTKFFPECRIFDPNFAMKDSDKKLVRGMGGSIDFLAIKPSGEYDIYDWKSQIINKRVGILPWKKIAYNVQLAEYVRILKDVYGLDNPGKLRDIPISTSYIWEGGKPVTLTNIEIGAFNIKDIPDEFSFLRPIAADLELSRDNKINELTHQLQGIEEAFKRQRKGDSDFNRATQLKQIRDISLAIQDLKLLGSTDRFRSWANGYLDQASKLLSTDFGTADDIQEAKTNLGVISNTDIAFKNLINELSKISNNDTFDAKIREDAGNTIKDLAEIASRARLLKDSLMEKTIDTISSYIKGDNLGDPKRLEKPLGSVERWFSAMSHLERQSIQLFHLAKTQAESEILAEDTIFLEEHRNKLKKFTEFAKSKGLEVVLALMKYIVNDNRSGLANRWSKEYRDNLEKAYNQMSSTWIQQNHTFDKKKYEIALEEYTKSVTANAGVLDDSSVAEQNIKSAVESFIKHNDVNFNDFNPEAYLNPSNRFLTPLEKWKSDKYKSIETEPVLKEIYEWFQEQNKEALKSGAVDKDFGYFRLPGIDMTEKEAKRLGLPKPPKKQGRWVVSDEQQNYFPEIDLRTGKPFKDVPVSYVNRSEVPSMDLFDTFAKFRTSINKYKGMRNLENFANMLIDFQNNKKSPVTNKYGLANKLKGLVGMKDMTVQDALEAFIDTVVYNKKDQWDKVMTIFGKKISFQKVYSDVAAAFNAKILGISPIPALSNLFGGGAHFNITIGGGEIADKGDLFNGIRLFTSKDAKTHTLIKYFNMDMHMSSHESTEFSGIKKFVDSLTYDNLLDKSFFLMEGTDWAVQKVIQSTLLHSLMITESGDVIPIKRYVNQMNKYQDIYSKPKDEYNKLRKEQEIDIKNLKETKSIYALASIENDKLTFPIDLTEKHGLRSIKVKVEQFVKHEIKKALGNMSNEDKSLIKGTYLGKAIMTFRSWIPELFYRKFGGWEYNPDTNEYELGYYRYFFRNLFRGHFIPLLDFTIGNITGNGMTDSAVEAAKMNYQKYKEEKENEGYEFRMTEDEFINKHKVWLKQALRDITFIIGTGLVMAGFIASRNRQEEEGQEIAINSYIGRILRHFYNETSFYFDPREFEQMFNNTVPLISLVTDLRNLVTSTFEEAYGHITDNEEIIQKNHPGKKLIKLFPFGSTALDYLGIINDDLRQSWGLDRTAPRF